MLYMSLPNNDFLTAVSMIFFITYLYLTPGFLFIITPPFVSSIIQSYFQVGSIHACHSPYYSVVFSCDIFLKFLF